MARIESTFLHAMVVAVLAAAPVDSMRTDSYKLAPPAKELDARAHEYVMTRRWVAGILVGGTLAGGVIGMIARRRGRRGSG